MTSRFRKRPVPLLGATLVAIVAALAPAASASPISDKQAEAHQVASDLERQAGRIRSLDSQLRGAQAELATYQQAVDQARANLDAATAHQQEIHARVVRHAQDAYALGGSLFFMSNLWSSQGGDDLVARRFYTDVVTGLDRDAIDELKAEREDLAARQADLSAAESAARDHAAALAKDRQSLQAAFAAQDALLGRVKGELVSLVSAEQAQRAREAAARHAATQTAPASGSPDGVWDCIRQLESGNNYSSPGGGAYQFTDDTWHGLGQTGTAGDATPALQDQMAMQLYSQRGFQPWTTAPRCGQV